MGLEEQKPLLTEDRRPRGSISKTDLWNYLSISGPGTVGAATLDCGKDQAIHLSKTIYARPLLTTPGREHPEKASVEKERDSSRRPIQLPNTFPKGNFPGHLALNQLACFP